MKPIPFAFLQAFWATYEAKLAHVPPDTIPVRPGGSHVIRRFLFKVTMSHRWHVALACLIGANAVVRSWMGSASWRDRETPNWVDAQEASGSCCIFFPVAERAKDVVCPPVVVRLVKASKSRPTDAVTVSRMVLGDRWRYLLL